MTKPKPVQINRASTLRILDALGKLWDEPTRTVVVDRLAEQAAIRCQDAGQLGPDLSVLKQQEELPAGSGS